MSAPARGAAHALLSIAPMFFQDWYGIVRVLAAGVLGYVALIAILRTSGKRTLSKMNAFDLVVTVALGSSFATMLLSRQVPILEGILAFALLASLQLAVTWMSVRSDRAERLLKSQPALVYFRGRFLEDALRRERLTASEIRASVRAQGFASLEEVDAVVLETAGDLSVVPRRPDGARDVLVDALEVRSSS